MLWSIRVASKSSQRSSPSLRCDNQPAHSEPRWPLLCTAAWGAPQRAPPSGITCQWPNAHSSSTPPHPCTTGRHGKHVCLPRGGSANRPVFLPCCTQAGSLQSSSRRLVRRGSGSGRRAAPCDGCPRLPAAQPRLPDSAHGRAGWLPAQHAQRRGRRAQRGRWAVLGG